MQSNKIINSKVYRFLDYVLRLILLNFVIVIPSFLFIVIYSFYSTDITNILFYLTLIPVIFWFFPSIVAVADVIKKYEEKETNTVFKDFFKSLKKHYVKSLLISIVIYICIILFSNSLLFFINYAENGGIYLVGLILIIPIIIIVFFILVHIILVRIYFGDLTIPQYFKLSFIMAFKDIGRTLILMIVFTIFAILLSINILTYYVMFLGGISIPVYFMVKISFKQYIKIYRKVDSNDC